MATEASLNIFQQSERRRRGVTLERSAIAIDSQIGAAEVVNNYGQAIGALS